MKVFGLNDKVEIQGSNYIVKSIDRKGIRAKPERGKEVWISRVNIDTLFDKGEVKSV